MVKLKQLLENSSEQMASQKLSREEIKNLYETVKAYNHYRKSLKAEGVYETVKKISDAINLAERYALKETNDWMESKMIQTDMKEMKKLSDAMFKETEKIKEAEKQMEMVYEQLGLKLERYFEIADLELQPENPEASGEDKPLEK